MTGGSIAWNTSLCPVGDPFSETCENMPVNCILNHQNLLHQMNLPSYIADTGLIGVGVNNQTEWPSHDTWNSQDGESIFDEGFAFS